MFTEEMNNKIQKLIRIDTDASKGYRDAASAVADADLQNFFNICSVNREQFAKDLKIKLSLFGINAEVEGSVAGSLHRTWLTLKADATDNNENVILEECIRGEEEAIEAYEDAMSLSYYPESIQPMINDQFNAIQKTLGQVKEWKAMFAEQVSS